LGDKQWVIGDTSAEGEPIITKRFENEDLLAEEDGEITKTLATMLQKTYSSYEWFIAEKLSYPPAD